MEGVLVTGELDVPVEGSCARCLEPIEDTLQLDVQELYAYEGSTTEATSEEDEVRRVEGDYLDLEPLVRDTVVLSLPLAPVCTDDCAGLCVDCGQRLDDLPADHSHEIVDARWAGLDRTRFASSPGTPGDDTHPRGELTVAVPKRKMSRANTRCPPLAVEGHRARRCRRARTAPAASSSPRTRRARTAASTPAARSSRSEPDRRGRALVAGDRRTGWAGARRAGGRLAARRPRRRAARRAARPRADPPVVRVRERRPAHQRAPGVPGRLGARPGRHRRALPQPARPARGSAGQAACLGGQHDVAGRASPAGSGDGGIGPHLLLGRGEETTGGREKDSILADAVEALIGAVHLGCGLDTAVGDRAPAVRPAAGRGRHPRRRPGLEDQPPGARRRPRARRARATVVADEGPDHAKTFTAAVVLVRRRCYGSGTGRTKKAAEQEAAEAAWRALSDAVREG